MMNLLTFRTPRRPAALTVRAVLLSLCALLAALAACSADRETPVGNDLIDDILGSTPGVVSVDTLDLTGDVVYTYFRLIDKSTRVTLGRDSLYDHAIVLRPNFSNAGVDTARTVEKAAVRIVFKDDGEVLDDDLLALFYELGTEYSEGDSVVTLDTLGVIVDPANGASLRQIVKATARYEVPQALAQAWIRGDSTSNGIAIVYQGTGEQIMRFGSRTADVGSKMQFIVNFTGGFETFYPIGHDGTFTRERTTTPNHVVSDGVVKRLFLRADLSQLNDSSAVHNARLRLHVVPGSALGTSRSLILYVPDSSNPLDPLFRTGVDVTTLDVANSTRALDFPVTLTLLGTLQELVKDNGFVVRFASENTRLRRVEFYTSTAGVDSLRPRLFVTSSTPATFDP